jgi:CRP-like cAMP-binding protein
MIICLVAGGMGDDIAASGTACAGSINYTFQQGVKNSTGREEVTMNNVTGSSPVSPQRIRESPLGFDLDDTQCRRLAEIVGLVAVEKGGVLLEEGHTDNVLYIVADGSLEVTKPTGGGDTVTLQVLHPGDMAGIMGFVDGIPHSAGIRALTQAELISLDRDQLRGLVDKDPELVFEVMRAVVRAAHRILGRMNTQYVEMSNYITKQHGRY